MKWCQSSAWFSFSSRSLAWMIFFPISRLLLILFKPVKIESYSFKLTPKRKKFSQNRRKIFLSNRTKIIYTIIKTHFCFRQCISSRIFFDSSSRRLSSAARWALSSNRASVCLRISSWYFFEAFFRASYASFERL